MASDASKEGILIGDTNRSGAMTGLAGVQVLFEQLASAGALDYDKVPQHTVALETLAFGQGLQPNTLLAALDAAQRSGTMLTSAGFEALLLRQVEITAQVTWMQESELLRGLASLLPRGTPGNALSGILNMRDQNAVDTLCGQIGERAAELVKVMISAAQKQDDDRAASGEDGDGAGSGDRCGNSKFAAQFAGDTLDVTAQFGTLKDFDEGLDAKIGAPNPNVAQTVLAEHCQRADSHECFNPGNYDIKTTSAQEYKVVTDAVEGSRASRGKRKVPSLEEVMAGELAKKSSISRIEGIALVLYTGPLFYKYNAILRGFPAAALEACKGNTYTTTLNALTSGVRKLMWVSPIPHNKLVYRGLGDVNLPPALLLPDEYGVCGGTEPGMMSCSSSMATAMQYIGGKRQPTVFEIVLGAVDRAASLNWCSQYPHEEEFLLPPFSFLEVLGIAFRSVGGAPVRVVRCRVNANLKTLLLEQLIHRRKHLHLATFRYNRLELEHAIAGSGVSAAVRDSVLRQLGQVEERQRAAEPAAYNEEHFYRAAVTELLDALVWAQHTLAFEQATSKDGTFKAADWTLRAAHRQLVTLAERQMREEEAGSEVRREAAVRVCGVLGLVGQGARALEKRNEAHETPLMQAAADGQVRHVRLLLEARADVGKEVVDEWGDGPLALAVMGSEVAAVQLLLEAQADVHARNRDAVTPLHLAAMTDRVESVRVLLAAGADVGARSKAGSTPLYFAAMEGSHACVRELLASGAEVNARNKGGKTPLKKAKEKGCDKCVALLKDAGAEDEEEGQEGEGEG